MGVRRAIVTTALGLVGLGAVFNCSAGNTGRAFGVSITLNTGAPDAGGGPAGTCTNQTLSEQNGATVRVVCNSGQFVSISPVPGAPFVGTHGGAYSYHFGSMQAGNVAGVGEFAHGAGSTASFRVFGVTEVDGRLDLLISY